MGLESLDAIGKPAPNHNEKRQSHANHTRAGYRHMSRLRGVMMFAWKGIAFKLDILRDMSMRPPAIINTNEELLKIGDRTWYFKRPSETFAAPRQRCMNSP